MLSKKTVAQPKLPVASGSSASASVSGGASGIDMTTVRIWALPKFEAETTTE